MKPKGRAESAIKFSGREDEKMHNIVDEVDRFFQSVHADIEDWKFSMEDYGDGTRIFVRFQIHINKSGDPPDPGRSKEKGPNPEVAKARAEEPSVRSGPTHSSTRGAPDEVHEPSGAGSASRADLDLASFVELWRRKRDTNEGNEYHKAGAPYLDAQSEWKGQKRSSEDASSNQSGERSDEEPKLPDPGT
jgi:hypothetical protein